MNKLLKIMIGLWLACQSHTFAQLKPTGTETLVKITVLLPTGKPLTNEQFIIRRLGAKPTEYPIATDDKGFCQLLLPKGVHYKIDFRGKAKPKMLSTPNEPNKELTLTVNLDRYQEGNAEITLYYAPNKTVKLVDAQGKFKTARTDANRKVVFWGTVDEKYTFEIAEDSVRYPIHPKSMIRVGGLSDGSTDANELFVSQYEYTIMPRYPINERINNFTILIDSIVKRNHWKRHLVVFTGGWFDDNFNMYQAYKKQQKTADTSVYVLASHCGICEKSDVKNIKQNPTLGLKHAGIAENDTESIITSLKFASKLKAVVLVTTRNGLAKKELDLLQKINLPVHIISCQDNAMPDVSYLALARATKGSLHTLKADISVFSKMKEGEIVEINGIKYRLKGKNYEIVP